MRFKRIDPQLLIAVGVLLVSFAALFVSIQQAAQMNRQTEILLEQTKSAAWPSLDIGMEVTLANDSIHGLVVTVENKGTGPAIVDGVRLTYAGEAIPSWSELFRRAAMPDSIPPSRLASKLHNAVISANEEVVVLDLLDNQALMQWFYARGEHLRLEICYKSVFDDHWLASRQGLTARGLSAVEPIAACAIAAEEIFLD